MKTVKEKRWGVLRLIDGKYRLFAKLELSPREARYVASWYTDGSSRAVPVTITYRVPSKPAARKRR